MRKVLVVVLAVLVAFSTSGVVAAASAATLGSISGRAIDATGRAVAMQRVDLVQSGQVIARSVTDMHGAWTFSGVAAGDYTVRTNINGAIAGTRVTVGPGQTVAGTTIVVPTSAVAPQFGLLASIVANVAVAGSTAAVAAATAIANNTEQVSLSETQITEIIAALPPAQRETFARQVVQAIQAEQQSTGESSNNPFVDVGAQGNVTNPITVENFVQQLNNVITSGGNATVNLNAS